MLVRVVTYAHERLLDGLNSFGSFVVLERLELDLDVDARGEREAHERVHRLRGRVDDVDPSRPP